MRHLPVTNCRDPQLSDFLEDGIASLDRALKHACKGNIKSDAGGLQVHSSASCIIKALSAQRYIHPCGKAVVLVPDRLSVPDNGKGRNKGRAVVED